MHCSTLHLYLRVCLSIGWSIHPSIALTVYHPPSVHRLAPLRFYKKKKQMTETLLKKCCKVSYELSLKDIVKVLFEFQTKP